MFLVMSVPNAMTTVGDLAGRRVDWPAALREHDRWLRTVVLARLGERQAVDEVIQEVSLAAIAQRTPLADPTKAGAWLYRLAVRKALLYRRRRGRQQRLVDRYAVRVGQRLESDRAAGDPLGWLLQDERRAHVADALQRLPRRDREVLLLKYTENWSYRELAEHLGCTTSAIEARLHRVRQKLRSELVRSYQGENEVRE